MSIYQFWICTILESKMMMQDLHRNYLWKIKLQDSDGKWCWTLGESFMREFSCFHDPVCAHYPPVHVQTRVTHGVMNNRRSAQHLGFRNIPITRLKHAHTMHFHNHNFCRDAISAEDFRCFVVPQNHLYHRCLAALCCLFGSEQSSYCVRQGLKTVKSSLLWRNIFAEKCKFRRRGQLSQ